jgi:hypothetical protein
MKRLHFLGLTCVCLGIAAMLLFRANTHVIAASPSSCGAWNYVPSPNLSRTAIPPTYSWYVPGNILSGVATISANDIWAVGTYIPNSQVPLQTLIEHWNGTSWSILPSPNVPSVNNLLKGVTAVSATDVWAVGETFASGQYSTLVEHWDGSTWSIIPSPNPIEYSGFSSVAAVSATDIWAVGSGINYDSASLGLLIEHWDGSQWSVVPSPTSTGSLNSVTAISTNNVWAVGMTGNGPSASLIEHWDGSQWSIVQHPAPSDDRVEFYGVSASSATDIWAIGLYSNHSIHSGNGLFEHWNGKKWSIVPGAPTSEQFTLSAVAAISPTDAWAVGNIFNAGTTTSTEHWDGTTWSLVPGPPIVDTFGSSFNAIASVPGSNSVWAVGDAGYTTPNSNVYGTFTAYYC